MVDNLLLHASTKQQLTNFLQRPAQSLLVSGPKGSGKGAVTKYIAARLLNKNENNLANQPYYLAIRAIDNKQIGIDEIRHIERFLQLTVPGNRFIRRVVTITDAELLSIEAQNALLKTLEEPLAGNVIILVAAQPASLLPTIRSRLQQIAVLVPAKVDIEAYFEAAGYKLPSVKQALAVSGGLPGLMTALLSNEEHPLVEATKLARQLLVASSHQRLLLVDTLAKQPDLVSDTLFILQQMAHLSLQTASTLPQQRRWQQILQTAYQAQVAFQQSAQPKLVLTSVVLSF